MNCWHCGTVDGECKCLFCGHRNNKGEFVTGPCKACEGRRKSELLMERCRHYGIDPRERRHWRVVRDSTGGSHRAFDPIYPGEER